MSRSLAIATVPNLFVQFVERLLLMLILLILAVGAFMLLLLFAALVSV